MWKSRAQLPIGTRQIAAVIPCAITVISQRGGREICSTWHIPSIPPPLLGLHRLRTNPAVRELEGWEGYELEQRCIYSNPLQPPGAELLVGGYKKQSFVPFKQSTEFVGCMWKPMDHKLDRTQAV